jgi:lysophospholipase L1-like esterase
MNKDFIRPFVIVASAAVLVGIIAMVIPAKESGIIKFKKMNWFERLGRTDEVSKADTLIAAEAATIASDLIPIKPFIDKLKDNSSNLRIAYFGDSIIEGDLITGKLRQDLQASHGGSGVGLVPITSIVSGFRQTIKHSFSKNWESISFMTPGNSNTSLGFTGFTFIPRNYYVSEAAIEPQQLDSLAVMDSSLVATPKPRKKSTRYYVNYAPWVEYTAAPVAGGASSFSRIRLFYSNATDSSIVKVSLNGTPMQSRRLRSGSGVQVLQLNDSSQINKIKLEFSAHDPIHVYGLSFDEPKGAYVDNFPIRGYSGMYFQRIHSDVLRGFQHFLNYDLIILQYGENVSNPKLTDYSYYEKGMQKTIKHIQDALPGVPILMISAHDRSIKINGSYHTSPDIPYLVKTQSNVAKAMNTGFWNLFAAMGGIDSMPSYVSHQPAWAGKDYTHFTKSGGIQIAKMLLQYLQGTN